MEKSKDTTAIDQLPAAAQQRVLIAPPRIGDYWPGEGGVYAGIIRDGDRLWHLILAIDPMSILNGAWGSYGTSEPGACSYVNGLANTIALVSSENDHPIAQQLVAYNQIGQDGHQDFYIPAQKENNLLYINLQEHLEDTYHWSSTQYSAYGAWVQDFEYGGQGIRFKGSERSARAVRRILVI